jgi:hypothetical protein
MPLILKDVSTGENEIQVQYNRTIHDGEDFIIKCKFTNAPGVKIKFVNDKDEQKLEPISVKNTSDKDLELGEIQKGSFRSFIYYEGNGNLFNDSNEVNRPRFILLPGEAARKDLSNVTAVNDTGTTYVAKTDLSNIKAEQNVLAKVDLSNINANQNVLAKTDLANVTPKPPLDWIVQWDKMTDVSWDKLVGASIGSNWGYDVYATKTKNGVITVTGRKRINSSTDRTTIQTNQLINNRSYRFANMRCYCASCVTTGAAISSVPTDAISVYIDRPTGEITFIAPKVTYALQFYYTISCRPE